MRAQALLSITSGMQLFSHSVATLHVEADSVRLLVVNGDRITDWGVQPLEPGLVRGGVVADEQAVGAQIRSLLEGHRVKNGRLVACLTGQRSVPRILDFPRMSAPLLQEAVARQLKREMPVALEDVHLSWQVVPSENGLLRVFALGVPRDVLGPLVQAIKLSGRELHSMDIKPLCLVRAVGQRDALIADLEPDGVDVVVVRDSISATIRTVSLGLEGSEVEDKIHRLGEELTRTVKFYSDTHPEERLHPSTPVFLTGSLAKEAAASGVVERSVGYPLQALSPPLDCPPGLPAASFMVNIGLALKEA